MKRRDSQGRETEGHVRILSAALSKQIRMLEEAKTLLHHVDSEIYETGMQLFTKPDGFALWLISPQRIFEGRSPVALLKHKGGRQKVLNGLRAVIHGIVQ